MKRLVFCAASIGLLSSGIILQPAFAGTHFEAIVYHAPAQFHSSPPPAPVHVYSPPPAPPPHIQVPVATTHVEPAPPPAISHPIMRPPVIHSEPAVPTPHLGTGQPVEHESPAAPALVLPATPHAQVPQIINSAAASISPHGVSIVGPRIVGPISAQHVPIYQAVSSPPLNYRPGIAAPGVGHPGLMDPGGYVRAPRPSVNSVLLTQSLLASWSNYRLANALLFNRNRAYANRNYGSWNYGWRWHPRPMWGIGYYNNYWYNNSQWNMSYFALDDYCPTAYVFDVASGQFFVPGQGYSDSLPYGYNAPLTVKVTEWMVIEDAYGQEVRDAFGREETEPHVFFYDAFFDASAGSYAYRDYRGELRLVSFPWFSSW